MTTADSRRTDLDGQVAEIRARGGDVFVLRGPDGCEEWKVSVDGEVVAAEWPDRGTAVAAYWVEQRRLAKRARR